MSERWRARLRHLWREWVLPLGVAALVLGSLRSAIADWNDVPSGSMKPTILEGDRVFVNKLAYDLKLPFTLFRLGEWAHPRRGDIVVLFSPHDGKRLVKRVVGLPGDRIEMHDHRLVVNGVEASYEPLPSGDGAHVERETAEGRSHLIQTDPERPAMPSFQPVTVPEGSYVVMGDNRDNSFDSRWFGFVPREQIVGRVTTVVLSFDLKRYYLPRWGRFMSGLQ